MIYQKRSMNVASYNLDSPLSFLEGQLLEIDMKSYILDL